MNLQLTERSRLEAVEDIFFGQAVIIWARWFLIIAAAALVLSTFDDQQDLIMGTLPIVALMAMNFYLHGRYLTEKPIDSQLIIGTSLLDLFIVTLLVVVWPLETGQTRLDNQFFLFYYPLVLAFAFVMPRKIEVLFTAGTIAIYAAVILLSMDLYTVPAHPEYSDSLALQVNLRSLLFRAVALGAVGGLANYYWRIQRARRHAVNTQG